MTTPAREFGPHLRLLWDQLRELWIENNRPSSRAIVRRAASLKVPCRSHNSLFRNLPITPKSLRAKLPQDMCDIETLVTLYAPARMSEFRKMYEAAWDEYHGVRAGQDEAASSDRPPVAAEADAPAQGPNGGATSPPADLAVIPPTADPVVRSDEAPGEDPPTAVGRWGRAEFTAVLTRLVTVSPHELFGRLAGDIWEKFDHWLPALYPADVVVYLSPVEYDHAEEHLDGLAEALRLAGAARDLGKPGTRRDVRVVVERDGQLSEGTFGLRPMPVAPPIEDRAEPAGSATGGAVDATSSTEAAATPAPAPPSATGTTAGHQGRRGERYDVLGPLPGSTDGRMLCAFDRSTGQPVVIKRIPHATPAESAQVIRLHRRLRHPNIVSVLDTGTTVDAVPYLVMKYLPDGSYWDRLCRTGPLAVADVLEVGVVVGRALEYAHSCDVVHGDVKPGNILCSPYGPLIADFGAANTARKANWFTPAYAAPEIWLTGDQSVATDVYSLGATLWTLLTGEPPFGVDLPDQPAGQLRQRVLSGALPLLNRVDVPHWLVDELTRAMARHPQQRHPGMAVLVSRLGRQTAAAPEQRQPARWPLGPTAVSPTRTGDSAGRDQ